MVIEKRMVPLKFDLMFKKVFGDKDDLMPLKKLLECILDIKPKNITILNPEIIGSSYYDKRTIVDLIVELEDNTQIGIEMNTNVNKYLIARNLRYLFKNIGQELKKGNTYKRLKKYIQINIDCEGKHVKPIERYKIMETEKYEVLTEDIEIIRVDLPYYVEKCYNKRARELDYKDKFIGLIGIEDISLAKEITKGDASMEEILKKVEDFSDDEEILGAYDAEWHKQQIEESIIQTRLDEEQERLEKAEAEGLAKGLEKGMVQGLKEGLEQGIEQEKINIVKNMLKEQTDINFISKVTGLSIEKINLIKEV